jgi:outer membrane murein-binding lipoprotein Lpp
MRYRILALTAAISAEQQKFKLLSEGPSVLAVQHLSAKVEQLEQEYKNFR